MSKSEQLQADFLTLMTTKIDALTLLINARFDDFNRRVEWIERAMNGSLK